jgi:hypothetical protein
LIASTAWGDVAIAGHDEDRRRKLRGIDLTQDGEAGLTGHVQSEQRACRHARSSDERFAFGKAGDAITGKREHHRQCIARR